MSEAREKARSLKLQIEMQLRDSAPTERIPLIELVLTSGAEAFVRRGTIPTMSHANI